MTTLTTEEKNEMESIMMEEEKEYVPESGMLLADCGHYCSRSVIMSTSHGSSCPDCYDDMSD